MDKPMCVACGENEVEAAGELCDDCFYEKKEEDEEDEEE